MTRNQRLTLLRKAGYGENGKYECRWCRRQLTMGTVTLDHLQPVSCGGDEWSPLNVVPACYHCNMERGAHLTVLIRRRGFCRMEAQEKIRERMLQARISQRTNRELRYYTRHRSVYITGRSVLSICRLDTVQIASEI